MAKVMVPSVGLVNVRVEVTSIVIGSPSSSEAKPRSVLWMPSHSVPVRSVLFEQEPKPIMTKVMRAA